MTTLTIDFYTEISCPWCVIAHHRLDTVLATHFPGLDVDIEHRPVILLPDCPPDGLRIADLLRTRYGVTDPMKAWARPHAEARASGLDLDLSRQAFAYPTLPAHTLIRLARARGTQHALAHDISHAYFMSARNIADADVLAEIAVEHGFSRDEARRLVRDDAQLARTQRDVDRAAAEGVHAVPRLVLGSGIVTLDGRRSEAALMAAITAAQASLLAAR